MSPGPEHQVEVAEEEEVVLDDVIQQINKTLPLVYRNCEANEGRPTDRINRKSLKIFRAMRDDPLLNEEGDDICLCDDPVHGSACEDDPSCANHGRQAG